MVGPGAELGPVRAVGPKGGLGLGRVDVAPGLFGQLLETGQGEQVGGSGQALLGAVIRLSDARYLPIIARQNQGPWTQNQAYGGTGSSWTWPEPAASPTRWRGRAAGGPRPGESRARSGLPLGPRCRRRLFRLGSSSSRSIRGLGYGDSVSTVQLVSGTP